MRAKDDTSCAAKVKQIRYPLDKCTPAMKYGIENEPLAISCSPDGFIGKDKIVEIKTSRAAATYTAQDAVEYVTSCKGIFQVTEKEGIKTYKLSPKHPYYTQVQGQLHISKRTTCIFVFWTPLSFIHVEVLKDDDFWKLLKTSLIKFYEHCLLSEILDSRFNRSMPIRESASILLAQAERSDSKKKKLNIAKDELCINPSIVAISRKDTNDSEMVSEVDQSDILASKLKSVLFNKANKYPKKIS
ncbi:hypothetical protein TKK_0002941 [Trichogramma kaykai]